MPPQHSDTHLLAELASHNAYFDAVVNMIPASLYVAGASGDDAVAHHPKYRKGQHKDSKEARKAQNKIAKREKFQPGKRETTLETKQRMAREEEEADDGSDGDGDGDIVMSDGDGEGDGSDEEEDNDAGAAAARPAAKNGAAAAATAPAAGDSYASRIEMLRAKLHAKMAEKRAAAGTGDAGPAAAAPDQVSKRAARRAEKRRRKEAAAQRQKAKAHTATTAAAAAGAARRRAVPDLGGSTLNAPDAARPASAATTPASRDLETIDYQALAGLKPKAVGAFADKSLTGGRKKKKSLEHLLADAERKRARLRELKASGAEEDKDKAKNIEWSEALKDAGGAASRKTNDPKLLKKALKRKAKKRAASTKAWRARLDQTKDAADKKQQIRAHNLGQRKLGGAAGANLSSKRIAEPEGEDGDKKEKRRRAGPHANRAGFEGKKNGFINGNGAGSGGGGGGGAPPAGGKGKQ